MPRSTRKIRLWIALFLALALGTAGVWKIYEGLGYTPGELIDYADKRLEGHARLAALARPVLAELRGALGEPSKLEELKQPFVIPEPPPLLRTPDGIPELLTEKERQIIRVGPSEPVKSISDAAAMAHDGDVVEIDSGEYHADVAVWPQKKLTIRGVGGHARLIADGANAEGKAIWVIRNGDFDIRNIDFIGARVPDRNGAGIRFEGGNLQLRHCLFYGNDNGLLSTDDKEATLDIRDSEFAYNGHGDGQSHNLYVGKIHSLKVTGCYFHHANVGHLLKSRAEDNVIEYNRLTDEDGGRASYELDFPNGGIALVMGNIVQKSPQAENSTLIAYGEEGYFWPDNKLYLASNTLVNDLPMGGAFLRVTPGAVYMVSMNNLLIGNGEIHDQSSPVSLNDIHAGWNVFVLAARQDYRLNSQGQQLTFRRQPEGVAPGVDLTPNAEYQHPMQVSRLLTPPRFPGAVQ